MSVVVWSKPACVQCGSVIRWLKKRKIEHEVRNLPDFPEVLEAFKELGLLQAPIVVVEGREPFSGFNTKLLEEYLVPKPEAPGAGN